MIDTNQTTPCPYNSRRPGVSYPGCNCAAVERDAARYRWFREHQTTFAYAQPPEVFDGMIDHLMEVDNAG